MDIIIDTREQEGLWEFPGYKTIHTKLDTGDYAIFGKEDKLCLERKKSVAEFAKNVWEKRFKDVLVRMQTYPHRYIIFEFDVDDVLKFPVGSTIPRYKWKALKITPQFMMRFISEIQINYDVDVIFAGDKDNATLIALNLMKRIDDKYLTLYP